MSPISLLLRIVAPIIGTLAIIGIAYLRARRQWRRREFFNRLNISLNSLRGGKLVIRTLYEDTLKTVFLNDAAVRTILRAAKRTTASHPLLWLAGPDEWFALNSVLNVVSEMYSIGYILADIGRRDSHEYLLCLTCEKAGPVRTRKIRAMLIRPAALAEFDEDGDYWRAEPVLESDNHHARVDTLRFLARAYFGAGRRRSFMTVEICLPN